MVQVGETTRAAGEAEARPAAEHAIRSHYTNIRQVIESKERFAKENPLHARTPEMAKVNTEKGNLQKEVGLPQIDERFVDVMNYHEQKQQKLRRVLLS